jgi:MFS family permease
MRALIGAWSNEEQTTDISNGRMQGKTMVSLSTEPQAFHASAYKLAWGAALIFYFLEYVVRSAPAVMIPELTTAFSVDAVGVSAIIGAYYYTYSITSLAAGAALDRFGAKAPVAIGAVLLGIGCLLFVVSVPFVGYLGRLLQGAGSAFAFTGAVFLATHGFSGSVLATAIGFTQCFGMLGGSAGQFAVGPLIHGTFGWKGFWVATAIACLAIGMALFLITPAESRGDNAPAREGLIAPFKTVFSNPQSYLCGIIAGLLFAPTTIGDMIWGVAFFQQDRGVEYARAVSIASMVPLGWVVGCPLLGWLADYVGLRKPTLILGAVVMLMSVIATAYTNDTTFNYISMFVLGVGSGAAMIPYTIIKEVNPDKAKGSAVGVINFITFGVTAAVAPIFAREHGRSLASSSDHLAHFKDAAGFWVVAIVIAIGLALFLRETGAKASEQKPR